jgi:hypothetical protein
MFPLVELPEIVRHYAPWFASVFSPEAFAQFQRYISGLILSENKTVEGINRLFVESVKIAIDMVYSPSTGGFLDWRESR